MQEGKIRQKKNTRTRTLRGGGPNGGATKKGGKKVDFLRGNRDASIPAESLGNQTTGATNWE